MRWFKKDNQFYIPALRSIREKYSSKLESANEWSEMMLPSGIGPELATNSNGSRVILRLIIAVILISGILLGAKLFQLQVLAHDRFDELSEGNRVRESISYAPRGRIFDRNGVLLADNTLSFQVSATPYLLPDDESSRAEVYAQVGKLLNKSAKNIRSLIEKNGTDYPLPQVVARNLNHTQALNFRQYESRLPGFSIGEVPTRSYTSEAAMAHVLGYTGFVSVHELEQNQNLLPIDIIGKTGVEAAHDNILRGQPGYQRTETDTLGRPIRLLAQRPAINGQDITLSIDIKIQRRLYKELKLQMKKANVSRASAVALDPNNGEVLAMVSLPAYDNNLFAKGISSKDFNKLANDKNEPLVNKVISGGYTTGSTIKPVVASAALEEKVVTPQTIIVDTGAIAVTSIYDPGAAFIFRGWRPGGLGPMNVRSAIAWSSNIYFYTVGGGHGGIVGLGVDRLTNYYRQFGLGEPTGIDLPNEITGRVPDRKWKKAYFGTDWFVGDTYNISIGQGDMLVSPLQLTLADMAVANGGYVLKPQLLLKIGDEVVAKRQIRREVNVSKSNLQIVREGMRQVLTGGTTCECTFSEVPVKVAGKSGTAQTTSDETRRPHAWYTAFAPFENPQIMGTAMLEEGSGGSLYAAPVIAGGMATFFSGN